MYDDISADYDRFVDWAGRLQVEMPFLQHALEGANAHRVLDAACGTGRHAIALAQRGYTVVGADLSASMIERARANAAAAGATVHFAQAGFGELNRQVSDGFDALLCLGNSLPHAVSLADLRTALLDFSACLRPGGLLLVQNRNFDAVLRQRQRWMEPQSHQEGEREWLFLRFYDFQSADLVVFNMVTLQREGHGPWEQRISMTRLRLLQRDELIIELSAAGFESITCYGDMQGAAFDPSNSPNLVVSARKKSGGRGLI